MVDERYEPVIGLEVHCQLRTATKIFSPEPAAFGAEPNRHVDPVSLGHPGTLPVLNRTAVEYAVRMGLATHCHIAPRSILARKHYFYPDLPKGYQISQYETPLCSGGFVEILMDEDEVPAGRPRTRRIGLTRIHLEEDAGKSLHDQDPAATLLDFNRCGTPLIEIVSEPDLRSAREAYLFVQKIRQIVRYLGICDGNMEEGSLRCDANVSVRLRGQTAYGTKTEIKNMNSFRNVERAVDFEIARQIHLIERGQTVIQETRLWDADAQQTRSMRSKEEAHDYRYFPDPDLVPVVVDEAMLTAIRDALPEMPERRRARFEDELGLPTYDADVLTQERALADYFEAAVGALFKRTRGGDTRAQAKAVSNLVMTDVLRVLSERGLTPEAIPIDAERLAELVHLRLDDAVSSTAAAEIFNRMLDDDRRPGEIAEAENLHQVSDAGALAPVVEQVLDEHPGQVETYLGGKQGLIGFFIGQVMRRFDGSPDPKAVRQLLEERLAARGA
ncbi:MAG: Asp-tRNA(Asn)/Glu-tRNA(Gln) amidotransferase subunit GatB [Rhodothermales bacterium]|nr:Asp-tRNA(Asn)/Glu-tRNA(Gln) amidotransferase subunit GatB [Rhodothermales bacterium]